MGTGTWTYEGQDLDALASRLAERLPRSERSLRAAGLGREDLLSQARLAVAELVRSYDPAKGGLGSWVLGGGWRLGADLARRGVGRVHPDDAAVQRAVRGLADATGGPMLDATAEVAERTGLPVRRVRRSLAALRDRTALGGVTDLEAPDAAPLSLPQHDAEHAETTVRHLWHVVEAASRLDAEHAGRRAGDADDVDPLRALLPGTLGLLVLARQADGATLHALSGETGVPVLVLADAARVLAARAREVAAAHVRQAA